MAILNIEKIKAEGLQVDLERYAREGYKAITNPEDLYRLKMHGICMQRHEGYFMFRMRVSGGKLNPAKMRRVADLAGRYGSSMVHLTTRQNIELHNVRIDNSLEIIRQLNEVGIFPRSACGHTFRNVMGSPCAGTCRGEILDVRPWVAMVSQMIVAKKDSYNERLPKRLNVSFDGCNLCPSPALVNDIGFSAVRDASGKAGFKLAVGGSMGLTARLGMLLTDFIPPEDVVPALKAVTELYIMNTDRKNPAKTRLKFLLEAWGLEKFKAEFHKLMPAMRAPDADLPQGFLPVPWSEESPRDGVELGELPSGVLRQRQKGYYRVPLLVQLGDIHHSHFKQLADWAETYAQGRVLITREQNLEIQWVPGNKVAELLGLAAAMGCPAGEARTLLDVQACPGTSFCTLAVTSSQGAAGSLIKYFDQHKVMVDPEIRKLRLHINGCANSCAQHQGADIGIFGGQVKVGEDTRYAWSMFLGGALEPEVVIGSLAKKAFSDEMLVPVVDALLTAFRASRGEAESFRVFLKRLGIPEVVKQLDEVLVQKGMSPNTYNRVTVEAGHPAVVVVPGG